MTDTQEPRWTPKWWIAFTSMAAFGVGLFGFVHELLSASPNLGMAGFSVGLIQLAPIGPVLDKAIRR